MSPKETPRALLVAMESAPYERSLPFAAQEISMLRELMISMRVETMELRPRKRLILDTIATCDIFHFAGHATIPDNLLQSSLLLEYWPQDRLTVANMMEMDIHNPFLAYLSACGTGNIKQKEFIDENMHLVRVFQLEGFRQVCQQPSR